MNLHDGDPFWPRRDGLLSVHPPLLSDIRCDAVVVGGGITGSLVALELTRRGQHVVVLDRRDIGGGSTSASTAMLQYEIDELLVDLVDAIGWDAATTAYKECARGIDLVERATQAVGDNCGFRRSPSVFMAIKRRDLATMRRELDARAAAGFDVRWLDDRELAARWGLVGLGAIESAAGGSVDPYRLCHRALTTVVQRGGEVYDRTEVLRRARRAVSRERNRRRFVSRCQSPLRSRTTRDRTVVRLTRRPVANGLCYAVDKAWVSARLRSFEADVRCDAALGRAVHAGSRQVPGLSCSATPATG